MAACLVLMMVTAGCADRPARGDGPRLVFLFDARSGDADEVTGPTLAGLRFAALATGPETIQPLNIGDEGASELLAEVAADPDAVAAVVAPWTPPAPGTEETLAEAGMPVISLTWAWGPPAAGDATIRLAADLPTEAELLVSAGGPAADPARERCVAGDPHPTSALLMRAVLEAAGRASASVRPVGVVDPERAATADAVSARLADLGCAVALWTGGAEALDLLVDAAPGLRTVVASSRVKTEGGVGVGVTHPLRRIVTVCACADITLTRRPDLQRFIHDYQTESGSAPGPFAIEAYDVGRWLLPTAPQGRAEVAARIDLAGAVPGLLGTYRIDAEGSLLSAPQPPGSWRAFGSRWLRLDDEPLTPLASALPLGRVVARVRPRMRPGRARFVHRPGRER